MNNKIINYNNNTVIIIFRPHKLCTQNRFISYDILLLFSKHFILCIPEGWCLHHLRVLAKPREPVSGVDGAD